MGRTRVMDPRVVAAVALLAVSTCGGATMPRRERARAVASMSAARAVGAADSPQAAFHLVLATDEMARAESLVRRGRLAEAQRAYVRANLDAELAIALQLEADAALRARHSHGLVADVSGSTRGGVAGQSP